jgi:putative membrane protein insertion efficiency factor
VNFAQQILVLALRGYQRVLSPVLAAFGSPLGLGCRFTPSCSAYALEAIQVRGACQGVGLAAHRLCRCHPWGGSGYDPVPAGKFNVTQTTLEAPANARRSAPVREAVLGTVPRQNS